MEDLHLCSWPLRFGMYCCWGAEIERVGEHFRFRSLSLHLDKSQFLTWCDRYTFILAFTNVSPYLKQTSAKAAPAHATSCWPVYKCISEMVTYLPISSPLIRFVGRYVDEAFGVAVGYNFFRFEAALVPFEIVACNAINTLLVRRCPCRRNYCYCDYPIRVRFLAMS